jgi:hypothetical protein
MQFSRLLLMAALAGVLITNTWVVAQEPVDEPLGPIDEEATPLPAEATPTLEPTLAEPATDDSDPTPVVEPTPAPSPGAPTIVPPQAVPAQPAVPARPRGGRMPTLAPSASPGATPVVPYAAPPAYAPGDPYAPHPVPGVPTPPGMLRQRCNECHSSSPGIVWRGLETPAGSYPFSKNDATPHGLEIAKRDSAMFRLEHDDMVNDVTVRELAERFRQTKDEEARVKLREEISTSVTEHFEVRQERRKLELERLQKQIDELATSLERRATSRDAIIKRRLAELLGEEDELSF